MFFMFSNRLGCLTSLAISAVISLVLLFAMGLVSF
jgi:energy-converting hydrogenase Eha subunit E